MSVAQSMTRSQHRPESKALVVLISALQLGLVIFVWILAILPAALLALGAMLVQALRNTGRRVDPVSPGDA